MKMANCNELENILRRDDAQEMQALEEHAAQCPACREGLRQWREISAAAPSLKKDWATPQLWSKISSQIAAAKQDREAKPKRLTARVLEMLTVHWQPVAVAAAVVLLAFTSVRLFRYSGGPLPVAPVIEKHAEPAATVLPTPEEAPRQHNQRLLTEEALKEIETSETAYAQSIDKLAAEIQPKIQSPTTPLLMNYREKLQLLDSAIAECRANIDQNRYNAYLRRELLSMYQEKRRTLQQLSSEDSHAQQ
jgi:hypothetical protein